jgi:hypothetical protein
MQYESSLSKLERARNISVHFVEAMQHVPTKELAALCASVEKISSQLNEVYMAEFRKVNPDFVKQEEQAKKDKETFDKNEILRVQAEQERKEEAARFERLEKERKNNEI